MSSDLICVARICRPHGIQGHVIVQSFTEDPETLFLFSALRDIHGDLFHLKKTSKKISKGEGRFIVSIKDIATRNQAEELVGKDLYILEEELPQLEDEDTFYHRDLIGCVVLDDRDGCEIGTLTHVHNFGAGDIIEIQPTAFDQPSFMLPFDDAFVPYVSVSEAIVRIRCEET